MSFWYTKAKGLPARGNLDFINDDLRILLVMGSTTADTEEDAEFIDDITTLDEYDGINYARKILANPAVTDDLTNDRAYYTSDGVTWGTLGDGTSSAKGAIVFKFVNDDTDSPIVAYIDDAGIFPFQGGDQNITIDPADAVGEEGWLDFE